MDAQTFDRLIATAARSPTRRTALRLVAASLLGTLLLPRHAAAQEDNDNDGLLDDDEVNVYGTRPDLADTDGDTFGDGQEICNRDRVDPNCQQDQVHINPLVNEGAAQPPPAPPPDPGCVGVGGACSSNTCCQPDPEYTKVQCCVDANGAGICTDVFASGLFRCPEVFPATGCPVGQTNCGGFCTDPLIDHGNCGACGNACSQVCGPDCNCVSGTCTKYCSPGLTLCGRFCVDLQTSITNCGWCDHYCGEDTTGVAGKCQGGQCTYPS